MSETQHVVPSRHPRPHTSPAASDNPRLGPLGVFAAVAVGVGSSLLWVMVLSGLPQAPFVLAATLFALIVPALALTARESGRSGVRALLRDALRLPRPSWWAPVAALAVPGPTWVVAAGFGGAERLTADLLVGFALTFLSSLLVINIWEEMAWTGFAQRRAMARWGVIRGSLVTAVLFAGIHLPLAFDGAESAGDVALGLGILLGTGVGLRLLIGHLDGWSGRSILSAAILHASFNATSDLVDPSSDWVRYVVTVLLGLAAVGVTTRAPGRSSATFTANPQSGKDF
jgi:membrane protease YdiL (CAAX protease family)